MIKVDMTKYVDVDGWGNCVSACLCTILGMNLSDIPEETQKAIRYPQAFKDYLRELGYAVRKTKDSALIPNDIALILVTGTTDRKYEDGQSILHLVVGDVDGVYHDPHKSKYGIDEVVEYEYLVSIESVNR